MATNLNYRASLDFFGYTAFDGSAFASGWPIWTNAAPSCATHYLQLTTTAIVTWTDYGGGPSYTHTYVTVETINRYTGVSTSTPSESGDACPGSPPDCHEVNPPAGISFTTQNATYWEAFGVWNYDDTTERKRIVWKAQLSMPYTAANWLAAFDTLYHHLTQAEIIEVCAANATNSIIVAYDITGAITVTPDNLVFSDIALGRDWFMKAYITAGLTSSWLPPTMIGQRAIHKWGSVPDWVGGGSFTGWDLYYDYFQPCLTFGTTVHNTIEDATPSLLLIEMTTANPGKLEVGDSQSV